MRNSLINRALVAKTKLFNYALLAAALLVGVNVNAQVAKIGSDTYSTIEAAFDAAQGTAQEPVTITMLADANFGTCRINLSDKYIVWDLAGKTVGTAPAAEYSGFVMKGGSFKMVNSSSTPATLNLKAKWDRNINVHNLSGDHPGYVIMIYGSEEDVSDYSTFMMDGDIRYTALGNDNYAIKIETPKGTAGYGAYGVTVDIVKGYVKGKYGALFVSGNITVKEGYHRPKIYVRKDAELEADDQCTSLTGSLDGKGNGDLKEAAQYYAKKKWNDGNKWTEQEAKDWALAYKESSAAIYGGGVAEWTINGYVHGGNGLYIKGGNVALDGARVAATAAEYHEPILKSSGFIACGSAIILDTNAGYAGVDGITISNSIVTSDNGYAIEEVVTKSGAETGIPDIVVNSGTFVGGKGAITTTEDTRDQIKNNNTITGGEWHNSDVTPYLDPSKNTVLEFTDSEGKYYQVVVPISKEAMESTIAAAAAKAEEERYAYIKEGTPEIVSSNMTIDFLLVDSAATVIVKTGAVLDAGTLMTEGSQIDGKGTGKVIVEAGGTLIISGEQGAYTYDENSLIVETSEATSGIVLINPAVVLNTTPKATVHFISKSWRTNADEKEYQYFGAPTVGGIIKKIVANPATYKTQLDVWNGTGWNRVGIMDGNNDSQLDYSVFNRAFGFYSILSTNPKGEENRITYTFTGNLYGNSNPEVTVEKGWAPMSNGFTGIMDGEEMLNVLENTGVDEVVYTPNQTASGHIQWQGHSGIRYLAEVKPMEVFMLRNNANKNELTLNYKDLVWKPATKTSTPGSAPRTNNFAVATVRVDGCGMNDIVTVAEDNMFSADFDNRYDAEKYNNEDIRFYVNADKAYDIYATDNLNNTFVGLMTTKAGKYTISFEDVTGNFALVDNKTNARIEMNEGTTYDFLAEAGEDAYRFAIVAGAQAPTDMQKTNAAVKTTKALINNQIVISNGERFFNVLGTEVK